MELDKRVESLEAQVRILKADIQTTLAEIRDSLPEQPAIASRWQKNAWVLALVNMVLAVVLFTNVFLFLPGNNPFNLSEVLVGWLRALWLALAFVWLILQMYPLALLLGQEDRQWRNIGWRNLKGFVRVQPGVLVLLTFVVLVVGILNTVVPAAWLIVALALLVAVASVPVRQVLEAIKK